MLVPLSGSEHDVKTSKPNQAEPLEYDYFTELVPGFWTGR
jgi:hypothetical protein